MARMRVKISVLMRFLHRLMEEQGIASKSLPLTDCVRLLGGPYETKEAAWNWVRSEWERREGLISETETLKWLKRGGKSPKPRKKKTGHKKSLYMPSGPFFASAAWKQLRYDVLKESDGRCNLCGSSAKNGVQIHVDHIKPRSKHPQLALAKSNLQVLCEPCNIGKSNRDDTDWRA